jgi:CRISPR-associated protein Csx10
LYHPFVLTLRAPALLGSLEGDPDGATTLDFIPGSVLRGAVARSLRAGARGSFQEIVLGGAVRYLHAFPVRDGQRSVPTPISLRVEKNADLERDTVFDLAAFDGRPGEDHETDDQWPGGSLGRLPAEYLRLAAQPGLARARRSARVHQQRDRVSGRPRTETARGRPVAVGTIFTYESLDADQTFAGAVLVQGDSDAALAERFASVREALEGTILIGRSRRAGYGGDAVITWGDARTREVEDEGVLRRAVSAGGLFRVLLTAPCIVRSRETGQVDPTALREEITRRLGGRAVVERVRWDAVQVGGFNRTWGLELPQALAVEAGSVLVLRATQTFPLQDLLALEHGGLGERTIEGFGRFCFLAEPVRGLRVRAVARDDRAPVAAPETEAPALAKWIEARIVDAHLATKIAEEGARIAGSSTRRPSTSLIGRLRVPLRGDVHDARRTLREWLGEGSGALRRSALQQVERCYVHAVDGRQSLHAWMRAVIDEDAAEKALGIAAVAQRGHVVSEVSARAYLRDRRDLVRVRLIDAVLGAMARIERQPPPPEVR